MKPDTSSVFTDPRITSFLPMSMRPQAHDIIRTWAFYTIVKTWMHHTTIPWNDIVISGHVLSDAQQKLSKSQGNASLTPDKLLEQYPADAIRYWTACGSLGHDVAFSEAQLKIGLRLTTKLWNAFRFIGEHVHDTNFATPDVSGVINQWLLDAASSTYATYERYFAQHEFGLALHTVENFFWKDFCDNYLELIKHQLFNPQEYSEQEVRATRWTLYTVGLRILQLYAPYMPYITETIYAQIYKEKLGIPSIHQTKFIEIQAAYSFPESSQTITTCIEIISQVRRLKTEKQLSLKTPLTSLTIAIGDKATAERLVTQTTLIKGITQAETILFTNDTHAQPSIEAVGESWQAHVTYQVLKP
jgi:valyl-tRNA synthetase